VVCCLAVAVIVEKMKEIDPQYPTVSESTRRTAGGEEDTGKET
jgi:hypothetical protein